MRLSKNEFEFVSRTLRLKEDERIQIGAFAPRSERGGPVLKFFLNCSDQRSFDSFIYSHYDMNLYYVVNPVSSKIGEVSRAFEKDISRVTSILIDVDDHEDNLSKSEFWDKCNEIIEFIDCRFVYALQTSEKGMHVLYNFEGSIEERDIIYRKLCNKFDNIDEGSKAINQFARIAFTRNVNRGGFESRVIHEYDCFEKLEIEDVGLCEEDLNEEIISNMKRNVMISEKDINSFPPCMRNLIGMRNLDKDGKLILATFLFRTGHDDTEIHSVFSKHSDYNIKQTSKRLRSIRKSGYYVPSCSFIKNCGLCRKDDHEWCARKKSNKSKPRHPMQFMDWKKNSMIQGKNVVILM